MGNDQRDTMKFGTVLLFLSVTFQVCSIFLSKKAALGLSVFSVGSVMTNPYYIASLSFMGAQVISWSMVLRRLPLFHSYLAMSLIYPFILVISVVFFNENILTMNCIGSLLIMAGVILINGEKIEKPVE